jgi:hypothetical protein
MTDIYDIAPGLSMSFPKSLRDMSPDEASQFHAAIVMLMDSFYPPGKHSEKCGPPLLPPRAIRDRAILATLRRPDHRFPRASRLKDSEMRRRGGWRGPNQSRNFDPIFIGY